MSKKFVRVLADVDCEWEGLMPSYRVYVNDELFAERTWRWTDSYLEEMYGPGRVKNNVLLRIHDESQ